MPAGGGIPPERHWASDPAGINQAGCIYTAQGFELDYLGVIIGRDLRWDPSSEEWIGDPSESFDSIVKRSGDRFTDLVKRTYRVLLTRGMKGCYVYGADPGTREHITLRTTGGTDADEAPGESDPVYEIPSCDRVGGCTEWWASMRATPDQETYRDRCLSGWSAGRFQRSC